MVTKSQTEPSPGSFKAMMMMSFIFIALSNHAFNLYKQPMVVNI